MNFLPHFDFLPQCDKMYSHLVDEFQWFFFLWHNWSFSRTVTLDIFGCTLPWFSVSVMLPVHLLHFTKCDHSNEFWAAVRWGIAQRNTLWQNPNFSPKIQFSVESFHTFSFEFLRWKWKNWEIGFLNKKLGFATVCNATLAFHAQHNGRNP